MSTTRNRFPFVRKALCTLAASTSLLPGVLRSAAAQQPIQTQGQAADLSILPDAPSAEIASVSEDASLWSSSSLPASPALTGFDQAAQKPDETIYKYVPPGVKVARPLSAGDKVLLGMRGAVYPIPALGWVISATWSEALNNSPNYGQSPRAYFQRLGAAAARNASEGLISDSIMSVALKEDPRYYKMGYGHPFVERLKHALVHVVITKTDSGEQTVNYALISGNLAGSALTNAYYPKINRGFAPTMETFGLSLGGSALGFGVAEFYGDALEMVRLRKKSQ